MLQQISLLPASKVEIKRALVGMSHMTSGQFPRDIAADGKLRKDYSYLAFFVDDWLSRLEVDVRHDHEEILNWCNRFEKGKNTEIERPKLCVTRLSELSDVALAKRKASRDFVALGVEFDCLTSTAGA